MKGQTFIIGTALLAAAKTPEMAKLNTRQVLVVTPATANVMGVSYQTLFDAISSQHEIAFGGPIVVRFAGDSASVGPAVGGPVVDVAIEKALSLVEKNAFNTLLG